jgi:hypothetical protein
MDQLTGVFGISNTLLANKNNIDYFSMTRALLASQESKADRE